jgi:hypothetical protein
MEAMRSGIYSMLVEKSGLIMPSPMLGISPLGKVDNRLFYEDDSYGWQITEMEDEYELKSWKVSDYIKMDSISS